MLIFQEIHTNINNDFDLQTGKFTCQISGTYVFMFSIAIYRPGWPLIHMVKNGIKVVTAHSITHTVSTDFDQASNGAVLTLQDGDQVWLRFGSGSGQTIHGSVHHKYDSFSGFLLYAN